MTIEDAVKKNEEQLLDLPNVTGVGIGERHGRPVILVFVRQKVPELALRPGEVVPKMLDEYETDVQLEIRVGSV